MKTLNKLLFLIILFGSFSLKSQNTTLGLTGNISLSKVPLTSAVFGDFKTKFALSGNLGVFLEQKISTNSSLGIEVIWNKVVGKDLDEQLLTDMNGQILGLVSSISKLNANYLAFPLYYRIEIGKFGVKAGVQPMVFLFASTTYKAKGELYNESYEHQNRIKNYKLDTFNYGPKIGIDYRFSKTLRFRADYYHGLKNISADGDAIERKIRQLNFGIQYLFRKNIEDK